MKPHSVYALYDPRDPENIRYIGYSFDPAGRLWSHLYEARTTTTRTRKLAWMRSLLADGVEPAYRVLCVVDSRELAGQREIELIAEFIAAGYDLVNGTEGGDGGSMIWTPELLERRSNASKEFWDDPDHRDRQREAMENFWRSPEGEELKGKISSLGKERWQKPGYGEIVHSSEARAKMAAAKQGKPHARPRTPEWNAKIAASNRGKKHRPWTDEERERRKVTPETRAKMSAAAKARHGKSSET